MGKRGPKPRNPAARFAEKICYDPVTGCWVWQSQISNVGYGLFYASPGKVVTAHRWAFKRWNDAIPDGLELDHLCRNRACANPWHLEPVTRSENQRRGLWCALRSAPSPEVLEQRRERTRELNRAKTARYRARKKAAV
jgi:hypothetical protein